MSTRAQHEIEHGRHLAALDTETAWGWGTPAGKLRAARRAALIIEGAALGPGMRALEIGCGTGLFTSYFVETGASIVATDISAELLQKARERLAASANVEIVCGRFEDLPLHAEFDAIIGSSVLHHLELAEALPRMFERLKPGGRFSFAEPNMLNPQVFLERHVPFLRERLHVSPDETAFVRWRFARQLRECGFVDVTLTPFDWLHPFTPPRAIPLVRAAGTLVERLPGMREFAGSLAIRARRPLRSL